MSQNLSWRIRVVLTTRSGAHYVGQEHFREELNWLLQQPAHSPQLLYSEANCLFILYDQVHQVDTSQQIVNGPFRKDELIGNHARGIANNCLDRLLDGTSEDGRRLWAHMRTETALLTLIDKADGLDVEVRMIGLLSDEEWERRVECVRVWAWGLDPHLGANSSVSSLNQDIASRIVHHAQYPGRP